MKQQVYTIIALAGLLTAGCSSSTENRGGASDYDSSTTGSSTSIQSPSERMGTNSNKSSTADELNRNSTISTNSSSGQDRSGDPAAKENSSSDSSSGGK